MSQRRMIAMVVAALLASLSSYTAAASPHSAVTMGQLSATPSASSPKASPSATSGEVKSDQSTNDAGLALPAEPKDVSGSIVALKEAINAAKGGNWWYFSAAVLLVIMFLLKFVGAKGRAGFWPKLGRWRYVISPVLSLAAALLAAFQGGLSFSAAIGVFTSAYAASSLEELWNHGILGKARESSKPS